MRGGFAEGIALAPGGLLSEGAGENLFVIRGGKIYTPPVGSSILAGITRDSVLTLARDLGIDVVEQILPRELLYFADEVFMTGTAAEITPVRSVDRKPVGTGKPGEITRALQKAFFGLFDGSTPDTRGWLTPIRDVAPTTEHHLRNGSRVMGTTLLDKIWDAHLVRAETDATPAILYVDLHLVHEVTSPQAFSELRARGLKVRRPERTLATFDHSTPTLPRRCIRQSPVRQRPKPHRRSRSSKRTRANSASNCKAGTARIAASCT